MIATQRSWITKLPDRVGGDACVRDTRITVWGLVEWRQRGLSDEQILQAVQGLTPADLDAAWDYYATQKEEVDQAIRANAEA